MPKPLKPMAHGRIEPSFATTEKPASTRAASARVQDLYNKFRDTRAGVALNPATPH